MSKSKVEALQEAIQSLGAKKSNERICQYVRNRYGNLADQITDDDVDLARKFAGGREDVRQETSNEVISVNSQNGASGASAIKTRDDVRGKIQDREDRSVEDVRRSAIKLSQEEFYYFCEWMKANKEKLLRDRPTHPETARMAQADLRFEISFNSIGNVQKVTGITWQSDEAKILKDRLEKPREATQDLQALTSRIDDMASEVSRLGHELASLQDEAPSRKIDGMTRAIESLGKTVAQIHLAVTKMEQRINAMDLVVGSQGKLPRDLCADLSVPQELPPADAPSE